MQRNLIISAALASTLGLVGCQVDEASVELDGDVATHSKDLVVTSGDNTVILTVSAADPALLDAYADDTFELVPLFERPASAASSDLGELAQEAESEIPANAVVIDEALVELEAGAVGYRLDRASTGAYGLSSCSSVNIHKSSRDYASVSNNGGICTEAKISTKRYSWSWYVTQAHASQLCAGETMAGGANNSNKVKLQICPGPSYSYYFYN